MRREELLRKGAAAELREKLGEREIQIKAKLGDISVALNEYLVDDLRDLPVHRAAVLMQDLERLAADYKAKRARLEELEG